jgi:hypothetical protein
MFKIQSPNAFALTLKKLGKITSYFNLSKDEKSTNLAKRFWVQPYLKQNGVTLPVVKFNID